MSLHQVLECTKWKVILKKLENIKNTCGNIYIYIFLHYECSLGQPTGFCSISVTEVRSAFSSTGFLARKSNVLAVSTKSVTAKVVFDD